uniref:Diuretic hormone class 2 n=1 Tax=Aceria tosichella TaxID=561515 RepID=A0A6G1SPH1_9ACAR
MNSNTMNSKSSSSSLALNNSNQIGISMLLLSIICISLGAMMMGVHQVGAMQLGEQSDQIRSSAPTATVALVENPELTVRVLENLLRSILYSAASAELQQPITNGAQKRGLDLGISRGFSGSQAGKHLMGLSAASFANGPGRR